MSSSTYVNANTNANAIGRITTTGKITIYAPTVIDKPTGIAKGPDGAMWFTNYGNSTIGRITTTVTPKIGSFTPASGPAGTTVTITGQNLSATTGHISVTTPAGTATSRATFTVT